MNKKGREEKASEDKERIGDKRESRKTVRTFALASFLNDLGAEMIFPIWPLFVTIYLGANTIILGLLDGLGDSIVSISQAASGYISDRIKRRKVFIWSGYLFGSLSRIGYSLSTIWQSLIPFRIMDRFGKIRDAPRDAIVADVSIKQNRGKNFGLIRSMDRLGAVVGTTICILLFAILGYKKLFLLAAVPSLIGAFLILFLIKEKRTKIKVYKGIALKDLSKEFKLFLVLSSFFALGSFSYSFLLLYAKDFGFQITFIPVLYLIFAAVNSASALPFGRLSDKIGRKAVLMLSFTLWAIVCLSFIFLQSYIAIIVAFAIYGLHKGALEPVQKTFVAELSPKKYRASGLGGFEMIIGLCALPASLFAGILWYKIGVLIPLYFSLCLTVIAMIMLTFVKEEVMKRERQGRKKMRKIKIYFFL